MCTQVFGGETRKKETTEAPDLGGWVIIRWIFRKCTDWMDVSQDSLEFFD